MTSSTAPADPGPTTATPLAGASGESAVTSIAPPPVESRTTADTHYRAARFDAVGDVVLAITRTLEAGTLEPRSLVLRAFSATSPDRAALAASDDRAFFAHVGAISYVRFDLHPSDGPFPWDESVRRAARLDACLLTGSSASERAAHAHSGLLDWLRTSWESELAFASFSSIEGSGAAFSPDHDATDDLDAWAAAWLAAGGYSVIRDGGAVVRKVLRAAVSDDHAGPERS